MDTVQYYAIFNKHDRAFLGMNKGLPSRLPQHISILLEDAEVLQNISSAKQLYDFALADDLKLIITAIGDTAALLQQDLIKCKIEEFKAHYNDTSLPEFIALIANEQGIAAAGYTDELKDLLADFIKAKREQFFELGFIWISPEGEVNTFELSYTSGGLFAETYNDRKRSSAIRAKPEKVKFGRHARPDKELIRMDTKEFNAFYKAYRWYGRAIEGYVAKQVDAIKRASSIAELSATPDLDFASEISMIPITLDARKLIEKTVNLFDNRRLVKQNQRLQAITALTDEQLVNLDASALTDNQRLLLNERLGLSSETGE